MKKTTRFRAYQLGSIGSSFSYFDGSKFTLLEARLTNINEVSINEELKICKKNEIDIIHITSWDNDHCNPDELEQILKKYNPLKIQLPGYDPSTEDGKKSLKLIKNYVAKNQNAKFEEITPKFIESLNHVDSLNVGYTNVLLHPTKLYEKSNDNSTVKLFRSGSFTVLSLGDVESPEIAKKIMKSNICKNQVDIMILAHHGADNGFTTEEFIKTIKPLITVCSSNYDNQFNHPKEKILEILYKNKIKNFTTKTGDVIIESDSQTNFDFYVYNYIKNNEEISSKNHYTSKRESL